MPEGLSELDRLKAENTRLAAQWAQFKVWACECAQLLDGWHNDGTAWSEWDESVRKRLSALQQLDEGRAIRDLLAPTVIVLDNIACQFPHQSIQVQVELSRLRAVMEGK